MVDPKSILVVSNACYPELSPRAFRTAELVREFGRRGHKVTLLLPDREIYRLDPLNAEGVEVVFAKGGCEPSAPSSGGCGTKNGVKRENPRSLRERVRSLMPRWVQRAVLYFYCHELFVKYNPGLYERLLELEGPFDMLISISYPAAVHLAVSRAMKRNRALAGAVRVAEFSDPPFRGDIARNVFPAYYGYMKRWARQFDYFTIPVEKALPCYTPYMPSERIRIIPQGFDLNAVQRKPYAPHGRPTFAYAGRFYERIRDPRFFFDFLEGLDVDFRFELYINHLDETFARMIDRVRQRAKGEIVLNAPLPRERLIEELSGMDFVINFDNTTANATPSKLIDYALSGRSVFSFNEHTFDPEVFRRVLAGDYSSRIRDIDLSRYDIRNVADRFLELTKKTQGGTGRSR